MPPIRKTSELWNHFTVVDGNKAKCSFCYAHISITNGNVSNLKRHLDRKHPSVIFSRCNPPGANNESQNREVNVSTVIPDGTGIGLNLEVQAEGGEAQVLPDPLGLPSTSTSGLRSTLIQTGMTDFVRSKKPVPINKSKEIDKQIVTMIVKEYHPFSLVEDIEFRKLLNLLCPGYTPPTRKTVSSTLIPQLHEEIKNKVTCNLNDAEAVCLTTDGWTSRNNESFVAITAHYLNSSMELKSVLLECLLFYDRHTADNLHERLTQCVRSWGIDNKICAIVTDNASNILAAVKKCNWRQVSCFAHSLNLALQAGLSHLKDTLVKVKAIVEHFKRSSTALQKLHSIQEQLGLPKLKLVQDCPTRWNSTFDMLNRFMLLKDAIVSTLALLETNLALLQPNEWKAIEKAVQVLEYFKDITEVVSGENYITLSTVIVLVNMLTDHLNSLSKENQPEVKGLIDEIKKQISERFKDIEIHELYTQATLLDPRFKKYSFQNETRHKHAVEKLKQKVNLEKIDQPPPLNEEEADKPKQKKKETKDIWKKWDRVVEMHKVPTSNLAASIIEVDKYMDEPIADRKDDPLKWWEERKIYYPRLYKLAKRRLCIQATSVPCERLFSKAGQIINEKRSRLKASKVSQVLFISNNL